MTKAELIEILKDVPDDAVIDIYDIRNITHPDFDAYFEYYKPDIVLNDFIRLCSFKNKIIMNSTFSMWSAFISNVIFENSYQNIICPNAFLADDDFNKISLRYDKRWNIVNIKINKN